MREIVVGVDGSPASNRALDRALMEADSRGSSASVVSAWTSSDFIAGPPGTGYGVRASSRDSGQLATKLVEEVVVKAMSRRRSDRSPTMSKIVVHGRPGPALVNPGHDAEFLVVGGHGHGYAVSALLGSATIYGLHHARCPVMVVVGAGPSAAP